MNTWLVGAILTAAICHAQVDPRYVVIPDPDTLGDGVLPSSYALAKSLGDSAEFVLRWQVPRDAAAWRTMRPEIDRAFRQALGLQMLPDRTPLNVRILRSHDFDGYTLENLVFDSRPGFSVTANLYRPKGGAAGKRAAVVAPIGHYLSAGKAASENQALCIELARLGFIALTYDAIGHGERVVQGNNHHEAGFALHPLGQTVSGWMVWDSMRAIDYLLTRDDVDPARIGITGNSGGGLNTLFTAAIDSRVKAAAITGYTFEFNNWIKYGGPHCTCTYLPAMYRSMEWFGIAGLIAPRAVLMLQGERDGIFPINGARNAGQATQALYKLLGHPSLARFDGIPEQPHAYSRPFRERMYGWMMHHLNGTGNGQPVAESDVRPLAESDPRLLCDAGGSLMARVPSVVTLAREMAGRAVAALPQAGSPEVRQAARLLTTRLTQPPDPKPHNLEPRSLQTTKVDGGVLEKVLFMSEIGIPIPGLLWRPNSPRGVIVLAHEGGKTDAAQSGMVEPLLQNGYAVLAVDTRGRGETLGRVADRRDNNFHLVSNGIAFDRPAAGRRAFDLKRAVDFIERRAELSRRPVFLAGFGGDAFAALLAAADDPRIAGVACSGFVNSFASQIAAAVWGSRPEAVRNWNSSAMRWGRLDNGEFRVDLGTVIPSSLLAADIPDIASLIAPRKLLFSGVAGRGGPDSNLFRDRFDRVLKAVDPSKSWAWYRPDQKLDANLLLEWLAGQ
jgi:dienelactone hydrolase